MERREFVRSLSGMAAAMAVAGAGPSETVASPEVRLSGRFPDAQSEGEEFWEQVQQSFSVDRSVLNLDNGAVSPSPRMVTDALVRYIRQEQKAPAREIWDVLAPRWQHVRERLAQLAGCDAGEIVTTRNGMEALDNVVLGLELRSGDEILVTTHDYWKVQHALDQRSARDGVVVRRIEQVPTPARSMDELVSMYERNITNRTRLLIVTHPLNSNGQLFPVQRICSMAHNRGVEVLVDGAQSFALVDEKISDLDCDYYGTSLHKWLCAPIGTGMLYIRGDRIGKVWPLFPAPEDAPRESMTKFMYQGTQSAATGVAISEAITFHETLGGKRKEARMRELSRYWMDRLRDLPRIRLLTPVEPEMSCGLGSFRLQGFDSRELARRLWDEHRILVQAWPLVQTTPGWQSKEGWGVRVTPNVYTTFDELDTFCGAIEELT